MVGLGRQAANTLKFFVKIITILDDGPFFYNRIVLVVFDGSNFLTDAFAVHWHNGPT